MSVSDVRTKGRGGARFGARREITAEHWEKRRFSPIFSRFGSKFARFSSIAKTFTVRKDVTSGIGQVFGVYFLGGHFLVLGDFRFFVPT